MSRSRVEFLRTALATYLLAACIAFGCARPVGTIDAGSRPTAASESGVTGDAGEIVLDPDAASAVQQRQTPPGERAVGYMVMVAGVIVLVLFAIAVYSVAKIIGG